MDFDLQRPIQEEGHGGHGGHGDGCQKLVAKKLFTRPGKLLHN